MTAPSDFSFLVPRFSFLVSRWRCDQALKTGNKVGGHNWALAKEHFKLDIRKYAFAQRTVNEWNKLPGECVNATSVNMF